MNDSAHGQDGGRGPEGVPVPRMSRAAPSRATWLVACAVLALAGLLAGYFLAIGRARPSTAGPGRPETDQARHVRYWTCSMHPWVHAAEKGKCPICFMDLVPVYETPGGGQTDAPRLVLSKEARDLAEIQTSPVAYRPLSLIVRVVGKIDYDETRLSHVSAWVGGRIDKLYVDYTGFRVAPGDRLTYLYSPDLRIAQQEHLFALRRWQKASQQADAEETASAQAILDASRKKLELWGLLPQQIDKLAQEGRVDDHTTILAPTGGTVIAREAFEGKYVQAGERLFTIADLTTVWAVLDAYEMDQPWLRMGQTVMFQTDAWPGETFKGQVVFIQPTLEESTRTVKVRVAVPNAEQRLKPGMYVHAQVEAALGQAGAVREPGSPPQPVLSIPATAPLLTGTRAVVYVEVNPSLLEAEAVPDWPALIASLRLGGQPPATATQPAAAVEPAGLPVSRLLWGLFSEDLRSRLAALQPPKFGDEALRGDVLKELNAILARRDLYHWAAWKGTNLAEEAQKLLAAGVENLTDRQVIRLNRLLLEAAYPDYLAVSIDRPTYQGRQVELGPRAGDYYAVRSGLEAGEQVVTRGGFKIDAALQIQAKPSMMKPDTRPASVGHQHGGLHE